MYRLFLLVLTLLTTQTLPAQWQPGSIYAEHHWVTPEDDEAFLRVGGRYGYQQQPDKFPAELRRGDRLLWPDSIDLTDATRAEVVLEKVQSHEDSRNLRIAINGYAPLSVPEPTAVPEPQNEYMFHTDVRVDVPLEQLHGGYGNAFALTLDTTQRWNWPQNVFYAVTLRIYYPATDRLPVVDYAHDRVPEVSYVRASAPNFEPIRADYVYTGTDADWSGRGTQNRTHWQTFRGQPHHTVGSSADAAAKFPVRWDAAWLPEPQTPANLQVRLLGRDGKYRVSAPRELTGLAERPYTVRVYGGEAPRNWVTRSGEFEQELMVTDSVRTATAFQLNWVSWSPCYSNGVFLNGHLVWDRTDDCYVFATHSPVRSGHDVRMLQQGRNVVSTALTPLFRGQMVHGMEVQWPGMQLKVRYGAAPIGTATGH